MEDSLPVTAVPSAILKAEMPDNLFSSQQSDGGNSLSDQEIGALLSAADTPPPFQTVDPTTLAAIPGASNNNPREANGLRDFLLFNNSSDIWVNQDHAFTDPNPSPASTFFSTSDASIRDVASPVGSPCPPAPPNLPQGTQHVPVLGPNTMNRQQDYQHLQHHQVHRPPPMRAHSQPPEDLGLPPHPDPQVNVTFQRSSGHYLGRPALTHPYPHALRNATLPVRREVPRFRQHPYARRSNARGPPPQRGQGPTSVPLPLQGQVQGQVVGQRQHLGSPMRMSRQSPPPMFSPVQIRENQYLRNTGMTVGAVGSSSATGCRGPEAKEHTPRGMEQWKFRERNDQTTLAMGILTLTERMSRVCEAMKEFLSRGFGDWSEDLERKEIERQRQEMRNKNADVTELNEQLEVLPRLLPVQPNGVIDMSLNIPENGQIVKAMNHDEMTVLLEAYDIPFSPTMFLPQKKELYLRFIGANRLLMHRILD